MRKPSKRQLATLEREREASKLAESPRTIERLLRNRWGQLPDHIRERFRRVWYDANAMRLNAGNMSLSLEWRLRERPYDPIGKTNRQHSEGVVYLHGLTPETNRLWKRERLHFKNSPGEGVSDGI